MLLILLRHGIAEPRENFSDDAARPLTPKGREKTRHAVAGLKIPIENLDLLVSSPKIRARQTAEIASEFYPNAKPIEWPELTRDEPEKLWQRLQNCGAQTVLCVGHEPNLSHFASWILTGNAETLSFQWKKAGVCALEIDWETGEADLIWFAGPKLLRYAN